MNRPNVKRLDKSYRRSELYIYKGITLSHDLSEHETH